MSKEFPLLRLREVGYGVWGGSIYHPRVSWCFQAPPWVTVTSVLQRVPRLGRKTQGLTLKVLLGPHSAGTMALLYHPAQLSQITHPAPAPFSFVVELLETRLLCWLDFGILPCFQRDIEQEQGRAECGAVLCVD